MKRLEETIIIEKIVDSYNSIMDIHHENKIMDIHI